MNVDKVDALAAVMARIMVDSEYNQTFTTLGYFALYNLALEVAKDVYETVGL